MKFNKINIQNIQNLFIKYTNIKYINIRYIFIISIFIIFIYLIYRLYNNYIEKFYVNEKQNVDSFDIFDTLIARTVINPIDIFTIIENKINFKNFANLRIEAQTLSNQSFDDIYMKFKSLTNIDDNTINTIKETEISTEINNIIPIMCNINKVKDGDILVSDMYLTENDIRILLDSVNFKKNVKIYVSPDGKSSGYIWKTLLDLYNINSHTGDNSHSDINIAKKNGINNTILTNTHNFTIIEKDTLNLYREYSHFIRKFRLMNPYVENTVEHSLYNEQAIYNIPILCLICYRLNKILVDENRTTVLFTTRDGCLLINIFKKLYPQYNSIVFHSSRYMYNNYNDDYKKYIKEIYNHNKCIIFDMDGCFSSGRKLFMDIFGYLPRVYLFNINNSNTPFNLLSYFINTDTENIEFFNTDIIGSLINFKYINGKYDDIRTPLDNDIKHSLIFKLTVEQFVNYMNVELLQNNKLFDDDEFWRNYYINVIMKISPIINFISNEKKSLTMLANQYNSDKGNTYKCAHCYTYKYEEIIDIITNKNKVYNINLLEIGLNRDDTNSIPSLMIWKDYFSNIGNFHGFDIQKEFSKFNNMNNNTFIYIGDQSNKHDLQQLKSKQYDIIIDDGYHSSKCQQISFVELWENVVNNGYYIIEDLHWQPEYEGPEILKTKELFEQWSIKNYINSTFISKDDVDKIIPTIASIEFYDSKSLNTQFTNESKKNALVIILKK